MLFPVMNLWADKNMWLPLILLPVINSSLPLDRGFGGKVELEFMDEITVCLSYGLELK